MDAPPIQYARTEDGVNIAYWTLGEGPPLLYLPVALDSHAERVWELDVYRELFVGIGQGEDLDLRRSTRLRLIRPGRN